MRRLTRDPAELIPLKHSTYQVLLALGDGEATHGYAIMQAVSAMTEGREAISFPARSTPRSRGWWTKAWSIMGLDNDETPEDSWETIRLIHELELEQPDSKFTVTPLTFVPIGLLEKSDFYDIGNTMDPAKLGVMSKTWQHNFKYGIQKFMSQVGRDNPIKNWFFTTLAGTLGGVPADCDGKVREEKGFRARACDREDKGDLLVNL